MQIEKAQNNYNVGNDYEKMEQEDCNQDGKKKDDDVENYDKSKNAMENMMRTGI